MPNENKPDENQNIPAQPDAATTPIDLASAFKMLNQANREATQGNLDNEQSEDLDESQIIGGQGNEVSDATEGNAVESSGSPDNGGSDDGLADSIQAIDFNAYKQDLLRNIQRNAASQVRKEFNDQNIGYYSAAELTVRDEQTGQVRFRNPDVQDERDPNYYFKSRSEMQQFIQAWNQGVDFEYRKAVNEKQQELLRQEAPRAALVDFIPKFQAMDSTTQNVFDALLEGHEITDSRGKVVGFNVNLDSVAAQAARIAKSFGGGAQTIRQTGEQAPATQVSSEPALDAKTGNGQSDDEAEPTNIGEALKMLDKKNRKGK